MEDARMNGDDALPMWAGRLVNERERRGWNKHEMARRLRMAAGTEYPPVKSLVREVRNWETGKHFPRDWMGAYASAFGLPVEKLFGANTPFPLPGTPRTVGAEGARDDWDDDMYRRAAIQLIAALSAGTALPPGVLETVLSGLDRRLGDRAESSLEDWEETAWEYGHALVAGVSAQLAAELAAELVEIPRAIDGARSPRVRAGLQRVGAQLSAALAMALLDLRAHRAHRRAWRTARHAADASGDRDLQVWVRAREAHNARWYRPARVSVGLNDAAIELAGGRPSAGLAQAYANRAMMLSAGGDEEGARSALGELDNVFARLPASATRAPLWDYRECSVAATEGWLYAWLGDPKAERALDRELALRPAEERVGRVSTELARATFLVRDRRVAEGLEHAMTALGEMPAADPLMGNRRNVARLLGALPDEKAHSLPAARELRATLTAGVTR
jgi:hypothetical protein